MDTELARRNMIDSQIRPWDVLDPDVLATFERIPRDYYVPPAYRALAYADFAIPLGHGELMMAPRVEARMLQALAPTPGDRALEIGTGSGFVAALLGRLAHSVVSIDIREQFVREARDKLRSAAVDNVDVRVADGARGYFVDGPFDVIAITGSLNALDSQLLDMLTLGGRMFVVLGTEPTMEAVLVTKLADGNWSRHSLFETVLAPLQNAPSADVFQF